MLFRLIALSVFSGIVLSPVFYRYVLLFNPPIVVQLIAFILLFLFGLLPLGASERFEKFFKSLYPLVRMGCYTLYIGGVLLLFLTLMRDLFWITGAFLFSSFPSPFDTVFVASANKITLTVVAVLLVWALIEGNRPPRLRQITFYSPKITKPARLVALTDLHFHRTTSLQRVQKIIERVNALNPDAVVLIGDTVDDDPARLTALFALLKMLSPTNGIYFVTGNHEFYIGYTPSIRALSAAGAILLDNKGILLNNNLFLGGISDSECGSLFSKAPDIIKAFQKADSDMFRILLSHTPIRFKKNPPCDLELSGHTHGGQIFPFHIAPFLRYGCIAGLCRMGKNAWLYVSRGTGQWGPQMRLFAPAEITLVSLFPRTNLPTP